MYTGMGASRALTSSFAMLSSNSGCACVKLPPPLLLLTPLVLPLLLPNTKAVLVLPLPPLLLLLLLRPRVRDCVVAGA